MQSKAERTKEMIIQRTSVLFNTKGYAGTSLNDMTAATGLTKGSIYGNFKNKDDVALEAFQFNLGIMARLFNSEMDKRDSCRDKLLAYPDVVGKFSETVFPRGGCPILNTAIESDDTHPLLKEQAAGALLRWENKIETLLRLGIEAGEFATTVDPQKIALTILAMLEGAIMIRKVTDSDLYIQLIMDTLRNYIKDL